MRLNSRLSVTSQLSCSWIHTIWVALSKIITSWDFKIRMNWNSTEVAYAGRLKLNICGIFPTEKPQSKQKLIQYEAGHFDACPWISWWVDGRGITKRSTPRAQTDCPLCWPGCDPSRWWGYLPRVSNPEPRSGLASLETPASTYKM